MAEPVEGARSDLEAAIGARRELGPEYEPALVESFLEKIDQAIEQRVDARVAERQPGGSGDRGGQGFVLGIVSLGTGIPITAIAGETTGLAGVLIAWAGIVGVNAAQAWSRQPRRR